MGESATLAKPQKLFFSQHSNNENVHIATKFTSIRLNGKQKNKITSTDFNGHTQFTAHAFVASIWAIRWKTIRSPRKCECSSATRVFPFRIFYARIYSIRIHTQTRFQRVVCSNAFSFFICAYVCVRGGMYVRTKMVLHVFVCMAFGSGGSGNINAIRNFHNDGDVKRLSILVRMLYVLLSTCISTTFSAYTRALMSIIVVEHWNGNAQNVVHPQSPTISFTLMNY